MNKSARFLVLVSLLTILLALPIVSYSADLHFGIDVGLAGNTGFSHSKASHNFTYCEDTGACANYNTDKLNATIKKEDRIENNRYGGLYFNVQLGIDIKVQDNLNVTPYVGYGYISEFFPAPSIMLGFGIMGIVKADDNLSYIGGVESHSSAFEFREVDKGKTLNHNITNTSIVYTGKGTTLMGGVLYKHYIVKILYIANKYELQNIDTESKFTNKFLESQYPNKVSAQSVGLSIGLKY